MRAAADQAIKTLTSVLGSWSEVTAIGLTSQGEDLYDPYYSLSLDVYTRGPVRDADARETEFGEVGAFETSLLTAKDRFLMGEIPVRIEYKLTDRFDELVAAALDGECELRDSGTYAFRRVQDAKILVSEGEWFETIRSSLTELPNEFWDELRRSQESTVEHLFADLSAAAMREDSFYFLTSAGRFLAQLCALLFTINRRFEPPPRTLRDEVLSLPALPDSFPANLENFVTSGHGLSMSQRRELAEIMITSVLSL
ncbi:MAG: DUF4037 domain-containing protein [Spirochaetota bacterium]